MAGFGDIVPRKSLIYQCDSNRPDGRLWPESRMLREVPRKCGERAAIGGYHATSRRIGWTGVGRESNPHTRKLPVGSDQLGWGGDAGVLGDLWGISGEFWADSWGGGDLPAGGAGR